MERHERTPTFEQLAVDDQTARAWVRVPDGATAGVVVLHAWWGLNDDVLAYAARLADEGFAVIAPDMFRGQVATERADAERLAGEGDASAEKVVVAAVDRLAELVGDEARIAALGFSFGAAYAIWVPSERDRISASVAYYGSYWGDFVARAGAPLQGHFAERDEFEPDENVASLEESFRQAGRPVEIHRYAGTGHWFAEPSRDAYRPDAAELAFRRTVEFLRRELSAG